MGLHAQVDGAGKSDILLGHSNRYDLIIVRGGRVINRDCGQNGSVRQWTANQPGGGNEVMRDIPLEMICWTMDSVPTHNLPPGYRVERLPPATKPNGSGSK